MSETLVRVQGATRYVPMNLSHFAPNSGNPGVVLRAAEVVPHNSTVHAFERAAARYGAVVSAGLFDDTMRLMRSNPYGRILTIAEALALALFLYQELNRQPGVPLPLVPWDDAPRLDPAYWSSDFNLPPPVMTPYTGINGWIANGFGGTYGSMSPNPNGGWYVQPGDWATFPVDAPGDPHFIEAEITGTDIFPAFPGTWYADQGITWRTQPGGPDPWFQPPPVPPMLPMLNPNYARRLPSLRPVEFLDPPFDLMPDRWGKEFSNTGRGGSREVEPSPRDPPKKNEKEKKVLSRSRKFMVATFKALDTVSELSEIIDVFYGALPKETRKAFEKERGFHWAKVQGKWKWLPPQGGYRKLLDSAGQYGIGGGDWKIQALRDHWQEVDTEKAFRDLINNQTQDFLYGKLYQGLPKNTGHALDGGFEQFDKFLRDYIYV